MPETEVGPPLETLLAQYSKTPNRAQRKSRPVVEEQGLLFMPQ
jgi:hypothetical protein